MEYPNSLVSRYCAAQPPIQSLLSNCGGILDTLEEPVIHLVTYVVRGIERLSHALLTDERGDYHNSC